MSKVKQTTKANGLDIPVPRRKQLDIGVRGKHDSAIDWSAAIVTPGGGIAKTIAIIRSHIASRKSTG